MVSRTNISKITIEISVFVMLLLCPMHLECTSIAIIRTPKHIMIAADSLEHYSGKPVTVCKIHRTGSIVFAAAGIIGDRQTGFDVVHLATESAIHSSSVDVAEKQFEKISVSPFTRALRRIRRVARGFYESEITGRPEPLQVVFFGVERGIPTFALVYFNVTDGPKGDPQLKIGEKECPGNGCPNGRTILMLEKNGAAVRASTSPSFWIGISNPAAAIRKLVEIEITAAPNDVGPPIEILSLDYGGQKWIQCETCQGH